MLLLLSGGAVCAGGEEDRVARAIDAYFASWSNNNMTAYAGSFHPDAVIHFVQPNRTISSTPLSVFVDEQRRLRSEMVMEEVPLSKRIIIEGDRAHAVVKWRLTSAGGQSTGFDHFVFTRVNQEWKIIYLIWSQD